MFYLKHKARPCSGSTGSLKSFFYLLRSAPKSANKTSNCLTDILKTYKSGRDTASTWIKPWNSSCCCFLMRTECTQNLTFLQDQLIMSWCQLHFFLFTVCFLRPNFLQKYNTYSVHGKFGCRKFVSLFTFSITHLVCGDIEDHKGQLWRRNNEVCMAKWNYIKVRHKKTEQKILSRKYKVWKTRSWYIHKWRTEAEQWITSLREISCLLHFNAYMTLRKGCWLCCSGATFWWASCRDKTNIPY